jgi:ubiquinone/menaquinone biosynthesis C-methylase UbiE
MNRLTLDVLDARPGERVLEVGFGGGELLSGLLARRVALVGVDRSEAMLARARLRFAQEVREGRLSLLHGSVDRLAFEDRSIDKACSVNTLYFWPDLGAAMGELVRVLRPGGTLVLCFQTPDAVRRWPGHRYGFHAYGVDEVMAAMRAAGLELADEGRGSDASVGEFVCLKGVKADG